MPYWSPTGGARRTSRSFPNNSSAAVAQSLVEEIHMNPHIFREYDIRGVVGRDLTDESVDDLARAIGTFFHRHGARRVSLGRDARASSPLFRDLLVRGFNQSGLDVLDVGMVPTPMLYYTLFTQGVDAGVMITGSHNPPDENGFKICLGKRTIFGGQIAEIKEIALARDFVEGAGQIDVRDVLKAYGAAITSSVQLGPRRLKVVV